MTQDEIIRMAREAGALVFQSNFCNSSFDFNSEQLERFAALVAAHEREKQAEQEPVAWARTSESGEVLDCISHTYKVTQPCTVDYDEPLYAAPVRTKALTDENAIRASEREAIKMDILFALEKDTGAWGPDKAYNDGFNYALDLVEQEIDKRNQMVFNTPVRTKDLTDEEAEFAFDRGGNELCLKLRAVIAADREKNK